ncbi:nucleotide exchange factor GrpE [Candidatus Karelsulcia muelleri]
MNNNNQMNIKSRFLKLIKYIEHRNIKTKEQIIKLMVKFKKYKRTKINKLIGILAEFENYKKRIEKNQKIIRENAKKNLLLELLSLAEDFNRCFNSNKDKNIQIFKEGIKIINRKLWNLLKKEGIKKINSKKGDVFNTDIHEAVSIQTIKKPELKGKILNIIESGYSLNKKIIKYTKVIVGKVGKEIKPNE